MIDYGYDLAGNRTTMKVGTGATVTTAYDAGGHPTVSDNGTPGDPADDTTYTTDDAGRLVGVDRPSGPDWTYGYDAWGRIVSATGASSIAYTVDALGRTVRRTEGAETTDDAFVGLSEELARRTVAGVATTYACGPEGYLAQQQGLTRRLYLSDVHDDVVAAYDGYGGISATRTYAPWGEVRSATGSPPVPSYQGDPADADTGLVDMTARAYDPALGRFTTPDPVAGDPTAPMSLNAYVYVQASPIAYHDPTGTTRELVNDRSNHHTRMSNAPGTVEDYWLSGNGARTMHDTYRPPPTPVPAVANLSPPEYEALRQLNVARAEFDRARSAVRRVNDILSGGSVAGVVAHKLARVGKCIVNVFCGVESIDRLIGAAVIIIGGGILAVGGTMAACTAGVFSVNPAVCVGGAVLFIVAGGGTVVYGIKTLIDTLTDKDDPLFDPDAGEW